MRYEVTPENICVFSGYQYSKWMFKDFLGHIFSAEEDCPIYARPVVCLCLEWATHNLLYRLHIKRERTRDVDLNANQRWWATAGYILVGLIAWILIP